MLEPSPIILIGAARSGTKFLRDVLAAGAGTAAVPYDVNYVWRYGSDLARDDALDPSNLTNKRKRFVQSTLLKLAKAQTGDILIEKTVASTLRVSYVDAVFPNARYVHLVRDGREVTESAMRQWIAPPDMTALYQKLREIPIQNLGYLSWFGWNFVRGLIKGRKGGKVWGPRFPNMDALAEQGHLARVCAHQWLESYKRASSDLCNIANSESRVFTIRYEDLISDETALSKLVKDLNLPDKERIISFYHKKLRPNDAETWRNLAPSDLAMIDEILSPTLLELGYIK
jgi:hypothetical protein